MVIYRWLPLTKLVGSEVLFVTLLAGAPPGQVALSSDAHVQWVAATLTQMRTVRPGMTRADLLKVFTTEGGLSTGVQRTFVSRECPYFKVDVEFEAVGRAKQDREGRVTLIESSQDVVLRISKPYLAVSVND